MAASLRDTLGKAFGAYEALERLAATFAREWNHSKSSGWMQKVQHRQKALFYLVPLSGEFLVSLTLREAERAVLLEERRCARFTGGATARAAHRAPRLRRPRTSA